MNVRKRRGVGYAIEIAARGSDRAYPSEIYLPSKSTRGPSRQTAHQTKHMIRAQRWS
jgi:hypothetical protein